MTVMGARDDGTVVWNLDPVTEFACEPDWKGFIRSTGRLFAPQSVESGFFVSPRIFLRALHVKKFAGVAPTDAEMQAMKKEKFTVSTHSYAAFQAHTDAPVHLRTYNIGWDLGVFEAETDVKLQGEYVPIFDLVKESKVTGLGLCRNGDPCFVVAYNGSVYRAENWRKDLIDSFPAAARPAIEKSSDANLIRLLPQTCRDALGRGFWGACGILRHGSSGEIRGGW